MRLLSVVEIALYAVLGGSILWMGLDARERWRQLRARRGTVEDDGAEHDARCAREVVARPEEGKDDEGEEGEGDQEEER